MKPLHPATLTLAYAADLAFGDPEWMPHPVRLIGKLIELGQRRAKPGTSIERDAAIGAALTLFTITAAYLAGMAAELHPVSETAVGWTTLATGSLVTEASAVVHALQCDDLSQARSQVARIVGRDTAHLGPPEIARAAIETLAESLCDGIVAPLFYLAIGGVPLALAYKALNTLDSMIGHTEHPHTHFGKLAARLDDGANFVPSRITALLVIASAIKWRSCRAAFATWIADGNRHPSPNAGQSEAAMAGALGVQLGGTNYYSGIPSNKPVLGRRYKPASVSDAKTAIQITRLASLLAFGCAIAFISWRRRP
jgi:adenosylcobinamide-phosphate synthase